MNGTIIVTNRLGAHRLLCEGRYTCAVAPGQHEIAAIFEADAKRQGLDVQPGQSEKAKAKKDSKPAEGGETVTRRG